MAYGQKNFQQEQGNGPYTIAEVGCFLTAFCNLLELYGSNINPPTLNSWFKTHGVYLKDPDGTFEDLAWTSVTKYDGAIRMVHHGVGPMPPSVPAIVKFIYRSAHTGKEITHFCLANKISGGQLYIVDSYDGIEKAPAVYHAAYGTPVEYATYTDVHAPAPAPAKPAPKAPAPAGAITHPGNTEDKYDIVRAIPGYITAGQAAARTGSNSTVPPGNYFVFNRSGSMVNVTSRVGVPGWWINPGDNVAPAHNAAKAPPEYAVLKPVPGYMTSNEAANHLDATVEVAPGNYFVFNEAHGMVNVTKKIGAPGAWINPADNKMVAAVHEAPKPAPKAVVGPPPMNDVVASGTAAPTNLAPNINSWQQTFVDHHDTYMAIQTMTIHDLAGIRPDVELKAHDLVRIAGTFTGPNGVAYGRTEKSVENGWWYGLPMSNLMLEENVFDINSDITTRLATNTLKLRDKLVIVVAKISGFMERFSKKA